MTQKSETVSQDQARRESPKVTVTMAKENVEFLDEVFIPRNPKFGDRSKAINKCVEIVRKEFAWT